MSNYLHWGQSLKGRMAGSAAVFDNLAKTAAAFAPRLKKELEAGTLPFIDMPFREDLEKELPRVMSRFGKNFKHMLLLGIGGSALGPRALQKAFMPGQDWPGHEGPSLWIADNVDAAGLEAWLGKLPPEDTLVVVISKSGGTIETMAQYFLVREWLGKALGADWSKNVIAITDAKNGALRQEAEAQGLASLPVPDNLGGRYSVLSAVGLVPAHFCGLDWRGLLSGAYGVTGTLAGNQGDADALGRALAAHPAWRLAAWARALMDNAYSQLIFFSYIPAWSCFGSWFCQLWAESLGKERRGSMPLAATGVTDQHSTLQMFLDGPPDKGCLFLESDTLFKGREFGQDALNPLPEKWSYLKGRRFGDLLSAEAVGTLGAMAAKNIPLVRLSMGETGEGAAGAMMSLLELTTLFTGWLLDVNPLDQPAVEYGKRLANARLGASGYQEEERALKEYFDAPDEKQPF